MKIGNLDISSFKVGGADCSIYLGDAKLYPEDNIKFYAEYERQYGITYTVECDGNPTLTRNETTGYTGDTPFYYISGVTIGSCVEAIGDYAFAYFTSIQSLTIPSSVTSIGNNAFEYCSRLYSLTVKASTPPTIGSNVFQDTSNYLIIYVPAASVDTYKAASGWSTYADRIQAITE